MTATTVEGAVARGGGVGRLVRRHGWTIGVYVLLLVLVLYWRSQTNQPWGTFDVQSLAIDALPLAFAACGQAIVIISGGIDLSIGSMMSLVNVVAKAYLSRKYTSTTTLRPLMRCGKFRSTRSGRNSAPPVTGLMMWASDPAIHAMW